MARPRRDRISIVIPAYVARINIIISKSKAGPRPVSALLSFSPSHCLFHFFSPSLSLSLEWDDECNTLVYQRDQATLALSLSLSFSPSFSHLRPILFDSRTTPSFSFEFCTYSLSLSLSRSLFVLLSFTRLVSLFLRRVSLSLFFLRRAFSVSFPVFLFRPRPPSSDSH